MSAGPSGTDPLLTTDTGDDEEAPMLDAEDVRAPP